MPTPELTVVSEYRVWIASGVVGFALCEVVWRRFALLRWPNAPAVASNLSIGLVSALIRRIGFPARVAVFALAYQLTPLRIPHGALAAFGCYLGVDLLIYWLHRMLHETRWGWSLHSVHHSSDDFELSLGVRTNWVQHLIDDLFYLPLPLLGFDPLLVASLLELNRLAQYWPHTEMIGRLPWLDPWLNTPSNHRVHHMLAVGGVRRNYGSNFMIWDRLFGTYEAETGPVRYGAHGHDPRERNPVRVQLAGLGILQRRRDA